MTLVPVLCAANGMLVNEDLFKKERIEIPQNWEQLVDACQKLKAAGYKSPILSDKYDSSIMAYLIYPYFTKEIMNNPEAIAKLNKLDNSAGEYTRSTLEWVEKFKSYGLLASGEFNHFGSIENSQIRTNKKSHCHNS